MAKITDANKGKLYDCCPCCIKSKERRRHSDVNDNEHWYPCVEHQKDENYHIGVLNA